MDNGQKRVLSAVEHFDAALTRAEKQLIARESRDPRAVQALLEAVGTAGDTGATSAAALIQIGHPAAVDPLIELLDNGSEQVGLYAGYALGGLKGRRAVTALARTLGDPSSSVRGIAAHALGQIGSRDALEPLGRALDDRSAHVRATPAYALASIGDRSAMPQLERASAPTRTSGSPCCSRWSRCCCSLAWRTWRRSTRNASGWSERNQ